MNYLNPGDQLTAAHWNDLFQQADTQLGVMLGGLSAVLAGTDKQWDRGFFFGFDPQSLPTTLHPKAKSFLASYLGNNPINQQAMYWRQYSHSAITGQLSGLSQLSNTSKWNVVKMSLPTWAAWSAAVYPSGFSGTTLQGLKQTISSVDYAAYNCLDASLQVHTATVSGTPYNVTFDTVLDAEHAQPLKGIDVFMLGNVTWDTTNWNKYSIVRAHNVGKSAATIFGTSINPGACRCFRLIAGTWTAQGNYFHWMQSGDGRFVQMRETGNPSNNGQTGGAPSCFMPGIVADVLLNTFTGASGNFGMQSDVTKHFDLNPIYNNPAYVKATPGENMPPVNGYLPQSPGGAMIGDLIVPRGKILVANRAVPNTIHATMYQTVAMTLAVPAPTYTFTDGTNTVANVSNAAVYNVTTGQTIPAQSDMSDPSTVNWVVNYGTMQIGIVPRGSQYDVGSGTFVPIVPAPYAPFISQGDVLKITFDYIPPDDHVWVDFDSFSTLAAKLTAIGLASRALSESNPYGGTLTNLEIYSASSWHMLDLSCPLMTFLTGGISPLPAKVVGSTQSSSPPSIKMPWLIFACTTVVVNPSSTTLTYKNWVTDSNGNPALGSTVTVTVSNDGSTLNTKQNIYLPTDSIATLQSFITTNSTAGGYLGIGNFQFFSTTFGMVMTWEEIWPLTAKFTSIQAYYIGFGGNVRTLSVMYEANVGLHVTRAIYFNETKYYTGDGWSQNDQPNPFENGVFPPIGNRLSTIPTARRFMFWNFARVDRQFQNSRWYQHLAGDTPWMPNTGYSNVKFASLPFGVYGDELSGNEFNNVVSFYEATPIGVDTVGGATARAKSGISRMGTFSRSPDIWSPFSFWLLKVGSLSYPNGASTGSITTTSGWYAANNGSIMSNATIGDAIPNVLPCQMEHYNAIGSLVLGAAQFKWIASGIGPGTSYTLNFAAANIIIVNGGSGFTVGQGLNFNLKVGTVDSNGAILTVVQNGSVVVNSYDAYLTPQRPFALGGNATCDTSVGDGSALNFIPTYSPTGVQTPSLTSKAFYGWSKIFPRNCYFSWNGPTAGGADPVGSYLAGLGVTVQSALPDSYGSTILNKYGNFTNGTYGTHDGASTDWCQGFTPAFQIRAQTYRWMTIDAARTLYGNFSLPFVLNANFAPMSFHIVESSQDSYTIPVDDYIKNRLDIPNHLPSGPPFDPATEFTNGGFIGFPSLNVFAYWTYTFVGLCHCIYVDPTGWFGPTSYPSTAYTPPNQFDTNDYQDIPANTITTPFNIGDFIIKAAEFINDASGSWLCDGGAANLCDSQFILNTWNQYATRKIGNAYTDTVTITGSYDVTNAGSVAYHILLWKQNRHTDRTAFEDNWGILNPVMFGTQNAKLVCRVYLTEGLPDQLVAALPQNYAYRDPLFVRNQQVAFDALGLQVIPYVADNAVELGQSDVQIFPGAGGAGKYDHVMTTQLSNARLVQLAVDGQITPKTGGGAGGSGGAGGGSGGGL